MRVDAAFGLGLLSSLSSTILMFPIIRNFEFLQADNISNAVIIPSIWIGNTILIFLFLVILSSFSSLRSFTFYTIGHCIKIDSKSKAHTRMHNWIKNNISYYEPDDSNEIYVRRRDYITIKLMFDECF